MAVGTMEAGEADVEVAAIEECLDGGGVLGRYGGEFIRVVVEDLPDRGGARLAGAVAGADHIDFEGGSLACAGTSGALSRLAEFRAGVREGA